MSIIQSKFLSFNNIRHAFSLRSGGVSQKPWDSLNCSFYVGDSEVNVHKNKKIILEKLGFINDFYIKQVHGNKIVHAEDYFGNHNVVEADGILCKTYNLPISITTADCAPILMADPKNSVIGVAHAGWRGAISGVTDNLIENFRTSGSSLNNIYGVIGPCISKESFEVKKDMIDCSIKNEPKSEKFFFNIGNLDYFDLKGFLKHKIKINGVHNIYNFAEDTYNDANKFFSYRRETKKNNYITGRMINIIGLFK